MADIAVQWLVFPLGSFPLPEEWPPAGEALTDDRVTLFHLLIPGVSDCNTFPQNGRFKAGFCWASLPTLRIPYQLKSSNHDLTRNEAVKDDTVIKRGTML